MTRSSSRRLAAIAEETWHALQAPLGRVPPSLTRVVLADQTELWNGYATPLPRNTIVLNAVWPSGSDLAFDDWLRLGFTHEFTHIVHLDRSEGWARGLRAVFGRTQLAFPNLFLPPWQIEGLATYEESVITGEGRLHSGDFRAIVQEAAAAHRLEPLDRVNGGLTDWPAGTAIYAYGLGFHAYLAERYGADTLAALAKGTARALPYTGSRAFKRVYGQPLGVLWRQYEGAAVADASGAQINGGPTRLTHQGFLVNGPRFDIAACSTCPPAIFYSASDADGFPGLYRVDTDGHAPLRLARRYLGSTTAVGRAVLYFDQMERRRNAGLYGDLYALIRATGRVRALTVGARLLDPDLSPDGTTLACVRDRPGQRDLVSIAVRGAETPALHAGAMTTLLSEPDTYFNAPRWSPDGRSIAVERHRLGSSAEVVVVDVATQAVRVIAAGPDARIVRPAWRPDGGAVIAAVAPSDETFNLHEFALDGSGSRQLTHTSGGATWPDVSPDGKILAFVGYTPDGYDIFSMPYPVAGRTFLLGGALPNASAVDFGDQAVSLLRGFATDTFAGSHVALVNADYRWPIARPQRGLGTWPLLLHTFHAAVFADAGHAWTRAFRTAAIKTSAGAELSADVVAGYSFPFTTTIGAAWGHDGSGVVRDGVTIVLAALDRPAKPRADVCSNVRA